MRKMIIVCFGILAFMGVSRAQTPNSCTSPNAEIPIRLIGNLYGRWNCWLQDEVYAYNYQRLAPAPVSEQQRQNSAAAYAQGATQNDFAIRFDGAMKELRTADPKWFDTVLNKYGLRYEAESPN